MSYATARRQGANAEINKLHAGDRSVHEWYRFVLSFPPHLVRDYLEKFGVRGGQCVLDPFCGTGTVLVECKKQGISSLGIEASPMAHFASQVKVDWTPDPDGLQAHARQVADLAYGMLTADGIEDEPLFPDLQAPAHPLSTLPDEARKLLLSQSMSPLPLHKALVLLDAIERRRDERYYRHERLALAKAIVTYSSNLHFGPEVGVGPQKPDAAVIAPWLLGIQGMTSDLRMMASKPATNAVVHRADARHPAQVLPPQAVDVVITSPPYPNEKDYTRTTRLESVLLGFMHSRADLRRMKYELLRSNTRNVYVADHDDQSVADHEEIQRIAAEIESRRLALGKTSGFERLYARTTKLYFGGMKRHLAELRPILRPNAHLAYVVGDQASYLRVFIPTGRLLADIATSLGYKLESIDLFRTRLATATRAQLREEVVVLRWPGR